MIAHIRKDDYKEQTVQEHSENVSLLAKSFGSKAGFSSTVELTGFLHDMGKSTIAFSTYIEKAVQSSTDKLEKIDHSTAGAKYLYEKFYVESPKNQVEAISNLTVEIIGMSILSHHSGLQNFIQTDGSQSDFFRRVCREDLPYYDEVCFNFFNNTENVERVEKLFKEAIEEIERFVIRVSEIEKHKKVGKTPFVFYSLAMKFIFSCLIDSDRTDARRFDEGDISELHRSYDKFFKDSYENLLKKLNEWSMDSKAMNPINQLRSSISEHCDNLADKPSSIYKLSIPTGGGKTLASLRYALKHAQKYKKDRIIYVVPYTTILEQNADAVRKVINNKEMVLEHHANVIDESNWDKEPDLYQRSNEKNMQLARDNFDYPIIFTTMVQFLDAFYARGTRKARRLHNFTNAVIIFDEVQTVPIKHISLFNSAVNFLHHFGESSIVLCTATQPSLAQTQYPLIMDEDSEMVENLTDVFNAFERVKIENKVTTSGWSAEDISQFAINEINNKQSILIILNTKKAVLNVYEKLQKEKNIKVYHLSTSMCPQHRKYILKEVMENLHDKNEKVICVSTQLIEAGVDISFECVIRSLAGLDSIAQAAGRCNRNGELDGKGIVYIVRSKDEVLSKLPELTLGQKVTEEDIFSRKELLNNLLGPNAIQTYFDFYLNKSEVEQLMIDSKLNVHLIELIDRSTKYLSAIPKKQSKTIMCSMFKTLETNFEVIEAPTTGVIVPYNDEAKEIISLLNEDIHDYDILNRLLKKAQLYSINIYSHTLNQLAEEDLIYRLYNKDIYVLREIGYHMEYGLSIEAEGKYETPIY